jgi:predicted acyl esterase
MAKSNTIKKSAGTANSGKGDKVAGATTRTVKTVDVKETKSGGNGRGIPKTAHKKKAVNPVKTSKAKTVALASMLAALPLLPRAAARLAQAEGERKGYSVEQFKLTARDGTRLSASLYVPRGEGPFPALIMIHSWLFMRWQCHLYAPYFASAGYVVLTYDCRGWGSSRGEVHCADPEREICDLEDVIDWLLEKSGLPLKEGALGVTGISYGGGHSFLIAARDPRVKTVVPMNGWTELKRAMNPNNSPKSIWSLLLLVSATWATKLNPGNILYRWFNTVLFKRKEMKGYDEDMRRRSCLHEVEKVNTPMLIVGSWNDDLFEPNQMMDFYEKLDAPKMLYISNGPHGLDPGFGPRWWGKDIWDLTRRWFDFWLKGEENGILSEPAVRLYRPWNRRMESEPDWPPPGVRTHTVYLGRENGDFKMTSRPKGERGEARLQPNLLSLAHSGPPVMRPQSFGLQVKGPRKDAGDGYFSFTTSPAKKDFELVGIPRLRVNIKPLEARAQINALLYDVPPEGGRPVLITYGTTTLEEMLPGVDMTVDMDLVAVDYLLKQGHCFRLTLSGTNLPFFLPVLGVGVKIIYGDGESGLQLPLREVAAN